MRGPQHSAIGRSIDLHVPTNRAILVLSAATFLVSVAVFLALGNSFSSSLLSSLALAGTTFLAWALGREVDPDTQSVAFFAATAALIGAVFLGAPDFLLVFWFLLGLRLINRSTGQDPSAVDLTLFCALSLGVGARTHWAICLLAFPVATFTLARGTRTAWGGWIAAALPAGGILFGILQQWQSVRPYSLVTTALVWIGLAVTWLIHYAATSTVRSVGDQDGEPLEASRFRLAASWALLAGGIISLLIPDVLKATAPVAAAFVAVLPVRSAKWIYRVV